MARRDPFKVACWYGFCFLAGMFTGLTIGLWGLLITPPALYIAGGYVGSSGWLDYD